VPVADADTWKTPIMHHMLWQRLGYVSLWRYVVISGACGVIALTQERERGE